MNALSQAGAAVDISRLSKTYKTREEDDVVALGNIDVRFEPGSFVAVVGPSGCGKSTLLSLLAGLTGATTGTIAIDGETISKPHPKIGVVFQSDLLLYWRTVIENILLPIEIKRLDVAKYRSRAEELLVQVGLEGFGNKYPSELSGGMRQRVAICRALIQEPGLMLMDEPFGALDALTREQMIMDLQAMWLRLGNTVLFITHGIDEAVFLADRVLVMSPRPGRVDLDLKIDIPRPRQWGRTHEDKAYQGYVRQIRDIFEAKGVLVAH
ncbi:MAG: ABC transporter ATP-binding protein [Hyphomicrobiales bacterium]|nr:MAG: ABC transporter ATP-binding protein [Hyphomicrobiales bacterium]